MGRSTTSCAVCESNNRPSFCAGCVNRRLTDYKALLKSLKISRDSLYLRLEKNFQEKNKAEDQANWRDLQNEKLANLKNRLYQLEKQLSQGKERKDRLLNDLKIKHESLDAAFAVLEKKRVDLLEMYYPKLIQTQTLGLVAITSELLHKQSMLLKQICRLFPLRRVNSGEKKSNDFSDSHDEICSMCLPKGLDPHSVPSEDLGASLGYMVQLLNIIVLILAAPALHNSGFAGSCSRIWQRNSYWDARPLSRSNEYPLFIPRQNICSVGDENSWCDRSSSNFGVASMDSERKASLDPIGSSSFKFSSASPHSVEMHKDLQKGISLLKKSVACITAYCYDSLYLDMPHDMSTFEAFGKLLATLSSSKEVGSVPSLKMACSRSYRQVSQTEVKSVWHMNRAVYSSNLADSVQMMPSLASRDNKTLSSSASSFFYSAEAAAQANNESIVDGWDIVEHPKYPPPPSHVEDVEHWTRAMFVDATKR